MAHIYDGKYLIQTLHPEFGWGLETDPCDTLEEARKIFDKVRAFYPGGSARIVYQKSETEQTVQNVVDDSGMLRGAKYLR